MKYLILAASLLLLVVMNENINGKGQITISFTGEIEFESSENSSELKFQNNSINNIGNTLPCIPAISSPCPKNNMISCLYQQDNSIKYFRRNTHK